MGATATAVPWKRVRPRHGSSASRTYTRFNDCSDQCTAGAQRTLSLRLGPQIQTLLSREGRREGQRCTGQSRSGSACLVARGRHRNAHTPPKPKTQQPWKGTTARGFIPRTRTPRKVGGS